MKKKTESTTHNIHKEAVKSDSTKIIKNTFNIEINIEPSKKEVNQIIKSINELIPTDIFIETSGIEQTLANFLDQNTRSFDDLLKAFPNQLSFWSGSGKQLSIEEVRELIPTGIAFIIRRKIYDQYEPRVKQIGSSKKQFLNLIRAGKPFHEAYEEIMKEGSIVKFYRGDIEIDAEAASKLIPQDVNQLKLIDSKIESVTIPVEVSILGVSGKSFQFFINEQPEDMDEDEKILEALKAFRNAGGVIKVINVETQEEFTEENLLRYIKDNLQDINKKTYVRTEFQQVCYNFELTFASTSKKILETIELWKKNGKYPTENSGCIKITATDKEPDNETFISLLSKNQDDLLKAFDNYKGTLSIVDASGKDVSKEKAIEVIKNYRAYKNFNLEEFTKAINEKLLII